MGVLTSLMPLAFCYFLLVSLTRCVDVLVLRTITLFLDSRKIRGFTSWSACSTLLQGREDGHQSPSKLHFHRRHRGIPGEGIFCCRTISTLSQSFFWIVFGVGKLMSQERQLQEGFHFSRRTQERLCENQKGFVTAQGLADNVVWIIFLCILCLFLTELVSSRLWEAGKVPDTTQAWS